MADRPKKPQDLAKKDAKSTSLATPLDLYLAEINRFPVLSRKEERLLAERYQETGDPEAAHRLVTANLRFVVKIAMQYSRYGLKLTDLIQEGNIGLMMAVKKYDPTMGNRLISYAVWWIRAYIQRHILNSWSIVKIGTTQAQRKLFNSLRRIQAKLRAEHGDDADTHAIAETLGVKESEVIEMDQRLARRDASVDAPLDHEGSATMLDYLSTDDPEPESLVIRENEKQRLRKVLSRIEPTLNAKERVILNKRILSDDPWTLQQIGDRYKISRERVRQLEERIKKKVAEAMTADEKP